MEAENYYQHNLETGKLNIYTTKAFYNGLQFTEKDLFKRLCLWSKSQDCWVSKGKAESAIYLKSQLKGLGFNDAGQTGEKLSFEQQVEREKQRAAIRADNAEVRADKADKNSDQIYEWAKNKASAIPMGQPILVGHHSEKRDRKYREKIDNTFRKAFQEADKARYYEAKAETARYTAEGKKYTNPRYLNNRIKESEKHIRVCERWLSGKYNPGSPVEPVSEANKAFYDKRIAEEKDKLTFYYKCMKAINPDWDPEAATQKKKKGKQI